MTWRLPRLCALFEAIITATSAAEMLARTLQRLQATPAVDLSDYLYVPPLAVIRRARGREPFDEERAIRDQIELQGASPIPPWVQQADDYWQTWVMARDASDAARQAAKAAAQDIDGSESRPLEKPSHKILEELNRLELSADLYVSFGANPFCYPGGVADDIVAGSRELGEWIERLRPLAAEELVGVTSGPGANDEPKPALATTSTPTVSVSPEQLERAAELGATRALAGRDSVSKAIEGVGGGAVRHGPVPKPDGWTRAELIDQANHNDGGGSKTLSGTTFDRIREAAGIPPGKKGGAGAQRRFSVAQLRKLIDAAEVGTYRSGPKIAAAWRDLLPS